MHHVAIVVYPGVELLDVTGPASVFNVANRTLTQRGDPPFYKITLVSADSGEVATSSGITLGTRPIARLRAADVQTVLIAGAEGEHLRPALTDARLRAAILRLVEKTKRFGSVCSGAYFLATLGLADGRRVATHWDACGTLAQMYPKITVDPDALYVVDGPLWTSAGVTTGIDMALAMVANDLDAGIAGEVAKRLVLYARRPGYQSQFSPLLQAQMKADNPFADLIAWIQDHLDEVLDVPTLAVRAKLSERTFHRKFVAATGKTPANFIEAVRLDAARMLLSRGLSLKSVAAKVGLFPPTRFAEAFERRFGVHPRLFREMHATL
jgi:transcriptional regulator GlxA family with amidase domain